MSILVVRIGLQGNRGLTGEAAPATITVANNIDDVVTVADNISDINDCVTNLPAIIAAPAEAAAAAVSADEAEAAAAGVNLPSVGAGDATKILKVNSAEDGYELALKIPDLTASKQGALLIQNTTDDGIAYLTSQGTAGQVLQSNEADADPSWVDPADPIGTVIDFAGTSPPDSYLDIAGGPEVSRTTYAPLFAIIGTTWGVGDGSTTFNLPDGSRNTFVGSGGSGTGTLGNSVGDTGGTETHTLTEAELPSSVTLSDTGCGDVNNTQNGSGFLAGVDSGAHARNIAVALGSGTPHTIMQPSAVSLKCIRYQ